MRSCRFLRGRISLSEDLMRLPCLGYGFILKNGKNHDTFIHSEFPQLIDQIPRHNEELSPAYARDAVKLIEQLLILISEKGETNE